MPLQGKGGMEKSIFTREYSLLRHLLRDARERAGVRQVELGERLGATQTFVSKVERGERRLDVVELRAFCLAIGMSLSDFVARFEKELKKSK